MRIRQKQVSSATSLPSHGLFLPPEFSLDELGLTSLAPIAVITGEWIIQRTAAPRTHFLFFGVYSLLIQSFACSCRLCILGEYGPAIQRVGHRLPDLLFAIAAPSTDFLGVLSSSLPHLSFRVSLHPCMPKERRRLLIPAPSLPNSVRPAVERTRNVAD